MGEAITKLGTTGYSSIIASAAVNDGAMSLESGTIAAEFGATEELYPLIDFMLDLTTAPTADGVFELYRRPSDGTNTAPAPTSTYKHQYVGSFITSSAADEYFLLGVENVDPNDTFYVFNDSGASETFELFARMRTFDEAA